MSQYKEIANKLGVEGYQFDLASYFSQGWKLTLKSYGWLLLFGMIYCAIWAVSIFIVILGPIAHFFILGPVLQGGVIYFLHKKATTGESDFSMFFSGFKDIGRLTGLNILIWLMIFISVIPMFYSWLDMYGFDVSNGFTFSTSNPEDMKMLKNHIANHGLVFFGGNLLSLILVFCVATLSIFANQFVIIGRLSPVDAIKSSIQVVKKKIFSIFLFLVILGAINFAASLPFLLGLLLTLPISFGATYAMFKNIVFSQISEEDNLFLSEDDILDA